MKATIDSDGYLKIEAGAIVESMSESDLRTFSKYAVFQEVVLNGIVDALVDGHMWNDDPEPAWWFGGDTFNKLRMKLVPLLPEITRKAVSYLEQELRRARSEMAAWRDASWKLEREWNESRSNDRWRTAGLDSPYHKPMTQEEAGVYLREVESKLSPAVHS